MTAEQLLANLDAAPDDETRAALLALATPEEREQLNALLAYRSLSAPDPRMTAFWAAMGAAADDEQRRAIIAAADANVIATLAREAHARTLTQDEALAAYFDEISA